ncbi:histidinol-phosphate transaminase [Paraferrimonas sp. SM1919]|uniref:histidinol-phosphate transaminase n=1 Tax=Paraferrimonas sp. SM1919 TaxID=2662263 RepID=UPI0013D19B24|nr:histidinol-phosphate transaminase [Paraferrimonas sp. SM1919]
MSELTFAQKMCRPEINALTPYQSARRIGGNGDVWINANESPNCNGMEMGINRYPDPQPEPLLNRYASYAGVHPEQIIVGRGADEAIELLIRTFCTPYKDSVAFCSPTYGMYGISAQTCGVAINELQLEADFSLPQDLATQASSSKLLFVCNPNNPTGTLLPKQELIDLCQALPNTLVVIDEAYIDFCPEYSMVDEINKLQNLVVLRTLSKAFALAGARVGFAIANVDIIDCMLKVIAPYPVPVPIAKLATKALSNVALDLMHNQLQQTLEQRQCLIDTLQQLTICNQVWPSAGNFVLAQFSHPVEVFDALSDSGIIARRYRTERLKNCIRFSIGSTPHMRRVRHTLATINEQITGSSQ